MGLKRRGFRFWLGVAACIILGAIFITAGSGKLPEQSEGLVIALPAEMFLTPVLLKTIIFWLPTIEIVAGALLVTGILARIAASGSIVLIAAFIFNNSWLTINGMAKEPCGCFGAIENSFLGYYMSTLQALYMDIGMLILPLIILFLYPARWFTIRPWFLGINNT